MSAAAALDAIPCALTMVLATVVEPTVLEFPPALNTLASALSTALRRPTSLLVYNSVQRLSMLLSLCCGVCSI